MKRGPVLGVDVGGTFTDVVLISDGAVTTAKVQTTDDQSVGALSGIHAACEQATLDPTAISGFRHGTTVTTNALLEGDGAKTALVTTAGFGDILAIGRQNRPELYDLDAHPPEPLVPASRRYEVAERTTVDGIEREPSTAEIAALTEQVADAESVAVSFLHAYAYPENERRVVDTLRDRLDVPVVASHETLAEFREYERTATTVVDAYVRPVIAAYLDALVTRTDAESVVEPRIIQSNGGIADAKTVRKRAATTVLSGPAAGVVGAALFEPDDAAGVVSFDMGGTSSDVGLVRDGTVERTTEASVGGHPVRLPMVDIETVGAGGGSVAWVDDGGALRVGPQSAGAEPGPVCYGTGGEKPTVTDAAVVLGYLGAETTLGERLRLDVGGATDALVELANEADLATPIEAARGVYRVANATMTQAIRRVTLERGHDPRQFALVAFGGAGPMHACALAERLGIGSVRIPQASGVLSALGMLAADERHDASQTHRGRLNQVDTTAIRDQYERLAERVRAAITGSEQATVDRHADLRYAGQSHELTISLEEFTVESVAERFHERHERRRGYRLDEPIELLTLRVTARVRSERPPLSHEGDRTQPVDSRAAVFGNRRRETPIYDRDRLPAETQLTGPAILAGAESTVVVPPAWDCRVDERGTLTMEQET